MAATAVGLRYNIDHQQIISAIEDYLPENNRSQIMETSNNSLIMDAYNANPTSMANALQSFGNTKAPQKAIIIGDMLELGKESKKEHITILKMLNELHFDKVFLVGKEFCSANNQNSYSCFDNVDSCHKQLSKEPLKGYSILIKGSRGIRLEKLKDVL